MDILPLVTTGFLIDFPDVEGGRSKLDDQTQGIRPYPIVIAAESILDVRSEMINSVEVVTEFRYSKTEMKTTDGPFDYETQERVVRLYLENGVAYRQDYVDNAKDGAPKVFNIGEESLKRLPIFSLNGQTAPVKPVLLDICDVDVQAYNQKSRRNHVSLLMGTTTFYTKGLSEEERKEIGGLGGMWHGPEACDFGSLSAEPSVISGYKIVLDEFSASAASFGARMFAETGKEAESAEALAIKNASSHATLGHLATILSTVIEDILRFVILWDTEKDIAKGDVRIEFSKDFIPATLNGQDLTALIGGFMQGAIPLSVFFNALKRGEIIPDGMTEDQFKTEQADTLPIQAAEANPPAE